MAHEFMHVTADTDTSDAEYAGTLLEDYAPGTEIEAIADVGGVATIMRLGVVDTHAKKTPRVPTYPTHLRPFVFGFGPINVAHCASSSATNSFSKTLRDRF